MKIKFIFFIIFNLVVITVFSQPVTKNIFDIGIFSKSNKGGTVIINQDERLETIVLNHIKANKTRTVWGWRVQIYFSAGQSARYRAESIKKRFLKEYPDIRAYIIYEAPFFKVRIGNYKTKFEAAKMKLQLQNSYEKIFLVEDEIDVNNQIGE